MESWIVTNYLAFCSGYNAPKPTFFSKSTKKVSDIKVVWQHSLYKLPTLIHNSDFPYYNMTTTNVEDN
jgi:hypothetical protein